MSEEIKRISVRTQGHVDKLREAGLDTQMFFDALSGIRDDSALSKDQRDALYKLVAMESFVWYMEALRGKPVDRIKLAEKAAELAEQNAAAIKKRTPGDAATALMTADIDTGPKRTPPPADQTLVDRPGPRPSRPSGGPAPRSTAAPRGAPKPRAAPRGGPTRVDRPPPRKK